MLGGRTTTQREAPETIRSILVDLDRFDAYYGSLSFDPNNGNADGIGRTQAADGTPSVVVVLVRPAMSEDELRAAIDAAVEASPEVTPGETAPPLDDDVDVEVHASDGSALVILHSFGSVQGALTYIVGEV